MYVTKNGQTQKINDDTYPYWSSLGWSLDQDRDGVPDIRGVPWLRAPSGWDTGLRQGIAAGSAHVMSFGDSVPSGQNTGATMTAAYPELVGAQLAARYGRAADHYMMWTYCAQTNTNFAGSGAPFSNPTGSTTWETAFGRAVELGAGQNTTFTTPRAGATALVLTYQDFAAGTFTCSVDGGSAQTITTTGASSYSAAKMVKQQTFPVSGTGTHTLAINGAAGSVCIVVSVGVVYAATGITLTRSGNNGGRLVDLVTVSGNGAGVNGLKAGPDRLLSLVGSTPATSNVAFDGPPGQPDLLIVHLGLNDCTYGSAMPAFRSALRRLIAAARRGKPNASILFLLGSYPDSTYSDVGLSGSGATWHTFKSAISELAASYNCATADLDAKWQSRGVALGFQGSGDLHPTAAGHADIAATIGALIAA